MEVSRIPQKPSLKIWLSTMAANVWAGTMVNVSVRGNDGILEVMKPQINYAPAMLVGKVVVSEGASFRTRCRGYQQSGRFARK